MTTRPPHARWRTALFHLLRFGFRAVPMSTATRDRLRARFLDRHAHLVPPPPRGQTDAGGHREYRLRSRADAPAIGHVPRRAAALPSPMPATLIAFYLPQFHPIPENDAWWGAGFTEWRNVTRALPQFEGHAQPRLPADLGFYDLRDAGVMRQQAALAREYGIGAFCSYFYWFGGRTLLETPLRNWLDDPTIAMPLCLCWANEKWARHWDGRGNDILIDQSHSAEDDLAFIAHVAAYLRDPRYLRVEGKPLLLVYRPGLLPDARATAQRWRNWCREHGIGEIQLAYVQGFERPLPADIGFDAAVEFPPNMRTPPSIAARQILINPDYAGDVLDWRELARDAASRALPDYPLYPGINPGWDNEPRRPGRGRSYQHASPRGYRDWLRHILHTRLDGVPASQRLVFINAWNEWAEGAVLEPDQRLGHAWLDATRQALTAAPAKDTRPCAVVHVWYLDVFDEILDALQSSGLAWRLVVTTAPQHAAAVRARLGSAVFEHELHVFENRGRDILPFLQVAGPLLDAGVEVVLKLHTKKSTHRSDGDRWRGEMLAGLLGEDRGARILDAFAQNPALGIVAPEGHLQPLDYFYGANEAAIEFLVRRCGVGPFNAESARFAAGTMLWARLEALRPVLDAHLSTEAFETEAGQLDGTLAHAVERLFGITAASGGYGVADVAAVLGLPPLPTGTPYRYARRY